MQGCMLCVLLVSFLLMAYMLNVIASSAFDSNSMVAVDGMGGVSKEDEQSIARKIMLMNLMREPLQIEDGDSRIVERIARVELMLSPFESGKQENHLFGYDSPQLVFLRNLRMQLQIPSAEHSKAGIANMNAASMGREGLDELGELHKKENDSEREISARRTGRGVIELAPHTIIDNEDSNFQNNIYLHIRDLRRPALLVPKENFADRDPPEHIQYLKGEKDSEKATLAIHPRLEKIRASMHMVPRMPHILLQESNIKSSSEGNDLSTRSAKEFFAQFVKGSLEKLPIADNLRGEKESSNEERKLVILTQTRDEHRLGFAWSHPMAVTTLSVCALLLLALVASCRMRRTTRRSARRVLRRPADDDEEMLVPHGVKHCATDAKAGGGLFRVCATPTPLWAQYLRRASSPPPVAVHAPRSTVRLMRDALRAYGQRQRSRSLHRQHQHPTSAGADANGPAADVPLGGTLHV